MFTKEEIRKIDRNYFDISFAGCFSITLKSKNTGHSWNIVCDSKFHTIYHTHDDKTGFHPHGYGKSLDDCIRQIKEHDDYQLKQDHKRKKRRSINRAYRAAKREEREEAEKCMTSHC